jgi:hypothetical protein
MSENPFSSEINFDKKLSVTMVTTDESILKPLISYD